MDVGAGVSDAGRGKFAAKIGDRDLQFGDVLQGYDKAVMCGGAVSRERAGSCSESCNQITSTGCGCCDIGNGLDRLMLIGSAGWLESVVCGLETCAGRGDFRLSPFLVGCRKELFEFDLGFSLDGHALPKIAVVVEETSLKNKLKSHGNDLVWRARSIASCRIFDVIFDLVDQRLKHMVDVVGVTEACIVVLKCCGRNISLSGVQVFKE